MSLSVSLPSKVKTMKKEKFKEGDKRAIMHLSLVNIYARANQLITCNIY